MVKMKCLYVSKLHYGHEMQGKQAYYLIIPVAKQWMSEFFPHHAREHQRRGGSSWLVFITPPLHAREEDLDALQWDVIPVIATSS